MAAPKVYVTRQIPPIGLDLLKESCDLEINPHDRPLTREELLDRAGGRDGVIGLITDRIDAEFFDAAPDLKGYANYAVGFDNVDVKEATKRGIPVSNTPDVLTDATAELAWALLFSVARRVVETEAVMRAGKWPGWGPLQFIGADVSGKTLGIVGAGRIGQAMAMMSRGFSMEVIYYNPSRPNDHMERELSATRVSFDELLARADFISVHTPLNEGTRHMFNSEVFKKMKPTAFLINTSRGPVINESELVEALKDREIAGAGLDVYENEPQMAPGLSGLNNVVIVPHIGSATISARNGMSELAARNLLAALNGQKPPNCLNPEIFE